MKTEPAAAPAKGKGKKGAAPAPEAAPASKTSIIPKVEDANVALQGAEAARSAALAILDKTKAMRKSEDRRSEGVLLQCVHVGRKGGSSADAKKALETASSVLNEEARGARGKVLLAMQKVRSGITNGAAALADLTAAFETADPGGAADASAPAASKAGEEKDKKAGGPAGLRTAEAELVIDIGRTALELSSSLGDDESELEEDLGRLALRCSGRAMSAKDAQPSSAVKLDFLKCHLMVREFETRVAVSSSELLSGALKKEAGTKLAQHATLSATGAGGSRAGSRDGSEGQKVKRSAIEHLADHAALMASQPLLDKLSIKRLEALQLKQRVEALKLLERALLACQRLTENLEQEAKETGVFDRYDPGAVPLVTEGCILVWNIAMPLLQSHLRKHVHRALGLAAQFLAAVGSPLQQLRVRLHYELARCEIATDFLAKAAEHFSAARLCDYGLIDEAEAMPPPLSDDLMNDLVKELANASGILGAGTLDDGNAVQAWVGGRPDEGAADLDNDGVADANGSKASTKAIFADENERRRPLDAVVLPAEHKLNLKKSIYEEPEKADEKALLLVEQAKEVTSSQLQKTLLTQAAGLLQEAAEDAFATDYSDAPDRKSAPQSDTDAVLEFAVPSADGRLRGLQPSASNTSVSFGALAILLPVPTFLTMFLCCFVVRRPRRRAIRVQEATAVSTGRWCRRQSPARSYKRLFGAIFWSCRGPSHERCRWFTRQSSSCSIQYGIRRDTRPLSSYRSTHSILLGKHSSRWFSLRLMASWFLRLPTPRLVL